MTLPASPIYQLLQRGLRALLTAPEQAQECRLAHLLGISVSQLAEVRIGPRYHYRPFSVVKPDGRQRRLLAPSPALKALQRHLLRHYLSKRPVHPAASAFRAGGSIAANARRHLGQALIATVDLADFFESTPVGRVRAFWIKEGWRGEMLSTLMRVCVYRNGLPQGAPTSPCLSNLVNVELDQTLSEIASRAGARYTRYADDLAFSWRTENAPGDFESSVADCLRYSGYTIQAAKGWTWRRMSEGPRIAGVRLNTQGHLEASAQVVAEVRRLRWQWWWKREAHTAAKLQGYEGFLTMLDIE